MLQDVGAAGTAEWPLEGHGGPGVLRVHSRLGFLVALVFLG